MPLKLAFLFLVYQFVQADFLPSNGLKYFEGRIFYGENANISDYPYVVKIHPYKKDEIFCGGSLITPNCVLTAAHCARSLINMPLIVRGGETTLNGAGTRRWVSRIFIPEHFDGFLFLNDVTILKLDKPMQGTNIEHATMDFSGLAVNDNVTIMGWGTTNQGISSNILQTIQVTVMSKDQCQMIYSHLGIRVADSLLCASNMRRDACQGDSGGPVIRNGKQVGVISAGLGCGNEKLPGVYTDLSEAVVRNFIIKIKNERCSN